METQNKKRITEFMKFIEAVYCKEAGLSIAEVQERVRNSGIPEARHCIMTLASMYKERSVTLAEIGDYYGHKHCMVSTAKNKTQDRYDTELEFRERFDTCKNTIQMILSSPNKEEMQRHIIALVELNTTTRRAKKMQEMFAPLQLRAEKLEKEMSAIQYQIKTLKQTINQIAI